MGGSDTSLPQTYDVSLIWQGSRGVVLEMATAFQIGEMSTLLENTPLADNTLFRGGGGGSDDVCPRPSPAPLLLFALLFLLSWTSPV